jgi:hypothetical protein
VSRERPRKTVAAGGAVLQGLPAIEPHFEGVRKSPLGALVEIESVSVRAPGEEGGRARVGGTVRAVTLAALAAVFSFGCEPSAADVLVRRCNAQCARITSLCGPRCGLSCIATTETLRCTQETYAVFDCWDALSDTAFCASPNECTSLVTDATDCQSGADAGRPDGGP